MVAITSKVQICNMAQTNLGNFGSISNIDTPGSEAEKTYSLWYDITRQYVLKLVIPNFAMERRIVAAVADPPAFGYTNVYEYPSDCLRALGIGDIDQKNKRFTIEKNRIYTSDEYATGLPLRFIKDVTDVGEFSVDFTVFLSWVLAKNVALDITQDLRKGQMLEELASRKILELSGMQAQENPPIRRSVSKFKQARFTQVSRNDEKQ